MHMSRYQIPSRRDGMINVSLKVQMFHFRLGQGYVRLESFYQRSQLRLSILFKDKRGKEIR
jgi:hypothetical protein